MLNLLSNAVKYNTDGGSMILTCQVTEDNALRICVNDTGKGLSPQQQQRLFTPFERLGECDGIDGTGIGLVITKRLVELMGGTIGVESALGEGSTFWVQVPLARSEIPQLLLEQAQRGHDVDAEPEPAAQATVLYVEDNPANLRLVKQIIEVYTPYSLIAAPDASLGLALAETHQPELILMDINLPGMDGYEARSRLQENAATRHIPVVAISANAMPKDVELGMAAGFSHYLAKPIDVSALVKLVKQIIG